MSTATGPRPRRTIGGARYMAAASILSLIAAGAAQAQATDSSPDSAVQEVVVTGSRIVRRDFVSSSPIVTVNSATFEERAAIGVETTLNQLPQFAPGGSQSAFSSAGTPFPGPTAAPGAATLNLRGLGSNRSLVLIDGRRPQPVNATLAVDVNTIPSAAIANVEVVTGGAASVYGADAIGGVVNFRMRRNFQGMELSGQYGINQEGDGGELQVSGLLGTNFADDRGNVMLGLSYSKRDKIMQRDRDFFTSGWADPGTAGGALNNSPLNQFVPVANNRPTAGLSVVGNYGIDQNGVVFDPTQAAGYTGPQNTGFKRNPNGSLGWFDFNQQLSIPLTRYALFSNGHYKVTEHVTAFMQGMFTETFTRGVNNVSPASSSWSLSIPHGTGIIAATQAPGTGATLPQYAGICAGAFGCTANEVFPVSPQLKTILDSRPNPNAPWTLNRGLDFLGNSITETTSNIYQFTVGLRGDIPNTDLTWEVYGSHGKTLVNAYQSAGFTALSKLQQVIGSPLYGKDFDIGANAGVLGNVGHCTSGLPLFNANGTVNNGRASQDCIDYVSLRMTSVTSLAQDIAEANLQGGLFNLPAGKLRFAAGAAYRKNDFKFTPDSKLNAQNPGPDIINNASPPQAVSGEIGVKEVYGELLVPIVKELPLINALNAELGYRYSDYNTAGGVRTWKALGDWAVTPWVRLRGGYQVANRAPNVAELFTPVSTALAVIPGGDPCARGTGSAPTPLYGNTTSNPNLKSLQTLCAYLIDREGGNSAAYYVPGASANDYKYTPLGFGQPFTFSLGRVQGNPDLDSERAKTWTLGGVIRSPWRAPLLDRLTLAIDWYSIDIKGAIATPTHDAVYEQCLSAKFNPAVASGSTSGAALAAGNPFCALIHREAANFGLNRTFDAKYFNQGGIKTSGFDFQLDWAGQFSDTFLNSVPGGFSLNVLLSVLDKYAVEAFPGAGFIEYKGTGSNFDYRLLTTIGYNIGSGSVGLRWQHLPSIRSTQSATDPTTPIRGAFSHDQLDLFGRWAINSALDLRAGVDNLLNAAPEIVGASTTNNNAVNTSGDYDILGRRFYVGVRARF